MTAVASLDMGTSNYAFYTETIDRTVEDDKIGNYALGDVRDNKFYPAYVGRSDSDLRAELKARLATKSPSRRRFKFSYASSRKEAFDKECRNYHDFSGLENENHPPRPEGQSYPCPVSECDALD
jgi:hypothetical protein